MKYNLITKDTESPLDNIHEELDNFINGMFYFHPFYKAENKIFTNLLRPNVEISQNKNEYRVKVQLPGVKKEDIKLELDDKFLTITAEFKDEAKEDDLHKKCTTSEFRYGKYQRIIEFDKNIRDDDIEAKYNNGILSIQIPKEFPEEEKNEPKLIKIKD